MKKKGHDLLSLDGTLTNGEGKLSAAEQSAKAPRRAVMSQLYLEGFKKKRNIEINCDTLQEDVS